MLAMIIGVVGHAILSYIIVIKMQMGIIGTGIAGIISNFSILLIMIVYGAMIPEIS